MRTTSDGRLAGVREASRFMAQLSRLALLTSVAAITLYASPAHAQPNRVTACDVLTAHPDDRQRVADPVPITERDPTRAIPACEEAVRADPNNARLRYQLGLAYDTARRFTDSFAAYQQAAQAGYVAAGHALAWAYANAEGTERNDAEAVRWYRWAAERGHTGSMNTLGFMLENGRGAPRDLIQAADWYRRAYDTDGRPIAAFNWARLLSGGRGVPQDNARAVQLFRVAAQAGRADAGLQLALMAERGEAPQVTQAELIQLLAIAEAGSAQRDRARRSLDRMNTEGLSGDIHLARGAASDMQASQDLERRAARQRREQALARVTQPAVASAPATPLTPAAPAQPAAAAAAPAVPASPSVSAQPAWLTTLWSNPVALAGAAGGIAVLLAGLGFRLGNRRGRQAAASVRQEPYVAPMPLVAAGAERSATMAPPAVAVSSRTAVPSSMDTSTKVAAGATQSVPVVQGTNQPDTPSVNSLDKQLPSQDPEQASKAWLAEAEARRVEAVRDWESRQQTARPVSAKSPSDHHADVQKRAMDEFARRQAEKPAVEQPHFVSIQSVAARGILALICKPKNIAIAASICCIVIIFPMVPRMFSSRMSSDNIMSSCIDLFINDRNNMISLFGVSYTGILREYDIMRGSTRTNGRTIVFGASVGGSDYILSCTKRSKSDPVYLVKQLAAFGIANCYDSAGISDNPHRNQTGRCHPIRAASQIYREHCRSFENCRER